ncbi:ArsR/SmtB family transcription factor [Alienimonas chondri]|uniref:Arsenic resistance transcriptional regulator ArsR2 n=1 Tax=Alienimonas chondri TaxID=2681879 RepID=A0ABX1VEU6_9PLAN|nr:metalloregulator ArsR/SmtB family transcription factor [Alienimonas chondri]NNJ26594.1 Arsenic resistance transcriptional regulator ArsR2 [Alienimonas chondri]
MTEAVLMESPAALPVRTAADELFRAFANPIRLRLLGLLWSSERGGSGEVCVCDLVTVLGVPQPTASRHLALLRDAGLATGRKDGAWCHYRLTEPGDAVHRRLLATLEAAVESDPQLTADAERLRYVAGCASRPSDCG